MKRRILLPTDFSKNAQNAVRYAINLYLKDDCDFYILNTYNAEPFSMELAATRDLEEHKRESITSLMAVLEKLTAQNTALKHHYHMVSECGSLLKTMKQIIAERDIDIVIMGTKGMTDSGAQIYGSQTALAMERIRNCPVLAIPVNATYKKIKQIVFPTGYRTPYKRREFQYLVDIAKNTGAMIHILHVAEEERPLNEDQRQKQLLLKEYFEDIDYSFHTIQNTDVQEALNSFIGSKGIDMVAFINKKHSFFSWISSKPMVKNLTYHSTIPVLALHDFRN